MKKWYKMRISLTLYEALEKCKDWDKFCEETGYSVYAVNEGGCDIEISLSEEQAKEHGIIR